MLHFFSPVRLAFPSRILTTAALLLCTALAPPAAASDCGFISDPDMRNLCQGDCGFISNSELRNYCQGDCGFISNSELRHFCQGVHEAGTRPLPPPPMFR